MPGSGKTTLGKQVAEHLRVDFVDLDLEIERQEQRSISEIFQQQGEDEFRLIEAKLLRTSAASTRSFVMATGGGAPCFHKGMEVINEHGISIFLDCTVNELVERVKRNRERPLLRTNDEEELRQKLERMRASRLGCYQQAKIVLKDPTLEMLLKRLEPRM